MCLMNYININYKLTFSIAVQIEKLRPEYSEIKF